MALSSRETAVLQIVRNHGITSTDLSDNDAQLLIQEAVGEYSRFIPKVIQYSLTTVTGIQSYDLPVESVGVADCSWDIWYVNNDTLLLVPPPDETGLTVYIDVEYPRSHEEIPGSDDGMLSDYVEGHTLLRKAKRNLMSGGITQGKVTLPVNDDFYSRISSDLIGRFYCRLSRKSAMARG